MTFKKLMLASVMAAAFGGLYGCTEGDKTSVLIEGDTTTNNGGSGSDSGGTTTVSENCPDWASAKNKDASGNDVCALPSTIMEDRTLTRDIVWYLQDRVTVGNGNGEMSATEGELANGGAVQNVTLTIESGTQIKGKKGTFANLLITRGSKITAVGTAAAPIVFSSDDDDYTGSGEWGGLIIGGYGRHNECDDAATACNVDGEGESGFAGGYSADDNSGSLEYVIVTEGGYEFAPGDEINGISLVAVGSGTTMDHVQVNANSDDGIEFFGGAIHAKHLVLTGNLDDSLDWDEGFQGNIQYVIVKQSADTFGTTIEADTFGTDAFLSKPVVANATFIGGAGASDPNFIHNMKEGTGGFIVNSILSVDSSSTTDPACIRVSDDAKANISAQTLVYHNVILDCSYDSTLGFDSSSLFMVSADLNASYASGAAEAQLSSPIDWTAFNGTYPESTADASFLDATDYIGAVDPNASSAWYSGWILDGSL
ncbi:hypothetical protein [Solimonas marina]|uniref:Lipoprotein n=1 Tax=Solimonas marina TaxID=2714601 RepID=A0A969W7V2_9GAMM|nr:hypothetical protein [Solimonas marina]NKF22232.1 hypothetical protein [Solimonas marina]